MSQLLRPEQLEHFQQMTALIEQTVAPSSWRVYADTYRQWLDWCGAHNVDLFDIVPITLHDFLVERGKTTATRQRMLSAMRRVANYLAAARPGDARQQLYAQVVRDMRVPDE